MLTAIYETLGCLDAVLRRQGERSSAFALAHGVNLLGTRLGFGASLERLANTLAIHHDSDLKRGLVRGVFPL